MSDRHAYTQQALNGGEVSHRFEARQDQAKYQSSLAKSTNWLPMVLGGVRRREGTIFVAEAKYSGEEQELFAGDDQLFAGADEVTADG